MRNSYAVDWSGKIGVGPTFEVVNVISFLSLSDDTPVVLAVVGGGVRGGSSVIIGLAKMFRLGVGLSFSSFLSLSPSNELGNVELTLRGFGFGVSLSGLLDIIAKDGGVLYLILSGGYSSASTEGEEKIKGPSVSDIGLGLGVEAFVLNSVGIAPDGLILDFFSGTVKQTVPTEEGGSVTVSTDTSAFNFGIFPSIRLSARIYF